MANKKIENWTLWIIGDLIVRSVITLIADRDVVVTIFNFTILAISAYLEWRKILRKRRSAVIKSLCLFREYWKTTLAIQLAEILQNGLGS
jgi:nicotinamide riboside transporter PnuC